MGSYINPANAITASRYLTLPPFVYYLDGGHMQPALLMIILCGVLDLFDGPVARRFNCSSGFGEMFDAATDALCYAFFILTLIVYGKMPWEPMAIFIGLGVINALMRLAYARRVGRTTNYRSWAMERVVAYTVYVAGLAVADFETAYYTWTLPFIMLVVVVHDAKRMLIDPVPE